MALVQFLTSIIVYVGGGCAIVYYAQDAWWQTYAVVAWLGFWMAGLRQLSIAARDAIKALEQAVLFCAAAIDEVIGNKEDE